MDEKFVLILVILCMAVALAGCLLKFRQLRQNFNRLAAMLSDVQTGHINNKLLMKETDMMAPLVFQANHIVYAYEEKLRDLQSAEAANKELMTSLAHDVRTPLTTLIGYLDAVCTGLAVGAEREEYVGAARQRAYDLKDYIDVLFDWFRLNSNEFTLSLQPVELAEATRNILKGWIPVLRENAIQFDIDIPDGRIMANVDLDGYTRVINNLVQNVIAHSHADEIKIIMTPSDPSVAVQVADNGIGIAKEDIPHIFDRLYKCDKGRSEKGSGLGLAIAHQMIVKMGGSLSAESVPGKTTVFTVTLPLVQ